MKINFYTILCFAVFPFIANAQQLKINEVMASNTATLASDLGNFGDWVELYNLTNADIDLSGLYFTDDITIPTKYQFPIGSANVILPPNGFKLIWADDSAQALHANFKLSGTTGETIAIFAADGITLIDSVSFGAQTTDVSYGRSSDGAANWTLFNTSTPNASNNPTSIDNNLQTYTTSKIYPNPTNERFFVSGNNVDCIKVIDISGKICMTMQANKLTNQEINISNLQEGIYLIQIIANNNVSFEKLIKQ